MIVDNHTALILSSSTANFSVPSRVLGIEPHETHDRGELRERIGKGTFASPRPSYYEYSVWSLQFDDEGPDSDRDGFSTLRRLLDVLEGKQEALSGLIDSGFEIELSWWATSDSSQGGFFWPADVLAGLAKLRCPIFATVYFDDDE